MIFRYDGASQFYNLFLSLIYFYKTLNLHEFLQMYKNVWKSSEED